MDIKEVVKTAILRNSHEWGDEQAEAVLKAINEAGFLVVPAQAQAVPEWKEYEKESPRIDGRYQIFINGEQLTANWETPFGFSSAEDNTAFLQHLITHWSMLPESPKEAL